MGRGRGNEWEEKAKGIEREWEGESEAKGEVE